jgi:hypothetical protein
MVNQYGGVIDQTTGLNPLFQTSPTSEKSLVLKTDIYFANNGNERMTVGLRSITAIPDGTDADTFPDANTANILEMGQWNAVATVPGVPDAPISAQPSWQFFPLAPELNRATPVDTVTNLGDIGAGWHQYIATITPTQITLELDLFRDGKTNLTRDVNGVIEIGVGADGVDSSITYDIVTLPEGFNSLRIGGPSGLASGGPGAAAFDNISLELVDAIIEPPTDNADFDSDGDVDGRDFLIWQRSGLIDDGTALLANGDANDDGNVDSLDLGVWQNQYGQAPPLSAINAVPEPTSAVLLGVALSSLALLKRR